MNINEFEVDYMNMDREYAWKQFEKSGSITDYLSYKLNPRFASGEIINDSNKVCSGVRYENMRKWDNHS